MDSDNKPTRPRTYLGNVSFSSGKKRGKYQRRASQHSALSNSLRRKRRWPWVVGLCGVVILGVSVAAAQFWDQVSDSMQGSVFGLFKSEPLQRDERGLTNILVFGTEGYTPDGSDAEGGLLTDSMMLLSINQDSGQGVTVSVPRDLWVQRRCWGKASAGKLNEVYSCAKGEGADEATAANTLTAKFADILGVEVHYFVHVNYLVLVSATDAVGGITVDLEHAINDTFANFYFAAGTQHLNGEKALELARSRHGVEGGDFGRGLNQQLVLRALQDAVIRDKKYLNPSTAFSLASSLGDNLRTNFPTEVAQTLIEVGQKAQLTSIPIRQDSEGNFLLRDGWIGEASVLLPAGVTSDYDYSKIRQYFAEQLP